MGAEIAAKNGCREGSFYCCPQKSQYSNAHLAIRRAKVLGRETRARLGHVGVRRRLSIVVQLQRVLASELAQRVARISSNAVGWARWVRLQNVQVVVIQVRLLAALHLIV